MTLKLKLTFRNFFSDFYRIFCLPMEIECTRKGSSFFVECAVVVRVRVCGVWLVGVGVFSVFFALPIFHSRPGCVSKPLSK